MKSLLDFFANSISFTQIKRLAEDRDFIYGVGHLIWPLQVYGNEPNTEQEDEVSDASSTRSTIARLIDEVAGRLRTTIRRRSGGKRHEHRICGWEMSVLGDQPEYGFEVGNCNTTVLCKSRSK